jgi:SAM-dependent methyltransferase
MNEDARANAKLKARAAIDAASSDYAAGTIDEATWQRRVADALATGYLGDADPRWQSGFDGDPDLWREARSIILDAVPADGSFLDVGCANGHLLECLATWAAERGLRLSLHGLELSGQLAEEARRRLPALSDRIYTGNASDWMPPHRFTYVRAGLEYVPAGREPALVARLLRDVVEPGGRLIAGPVAEDTLSATLGAFTKAGVLDPKVIFATDRNGKTRYAVWARNG